MLLQSAVAEQDSKRAGQIEGKGTHSMYVTGNPMLTGAPQICSISFSAVFACAFSAALGSAIACALTTVTVMESTEK